MVVRREGECYHFYLLWSLIRGCEEMNCDFHYQEVLSNMQSSWYFCAWCPFFNRSINFIQISLDVDNYIFSSPFLICVKWDLLEMIMWLKCRVVFCPYISRGNNTRLNFDFAQCQRGNNTMLNFGFALHICQVFSFVSS